MLEEIIRQFENQIQYIKDLTLNGDRQDTCAAGMKDTTQHSDWVE